MDAPEIGAYYALAESARLGEGDTALPPGALVKVVRVAPPGEPGVGRSGHETVIAEYVYDVAGVDGRGEAVRISHVRYLGLALPAFTATFTPAESPEGVS